MCVLYACMCILRVCSFARGQFLAFFFFFFFSCAFADSGMLQRKCGEEGTVGQCWFVS